MVSYLEFLQNEQLQQGLCSLVASPMSLFTKDLLNNTIRVKPLFLKYLTKIETTNTLDFTKAKKINPREEDELEYEIRITICNWLAENTTVPFASSAIPAVYWERTIPSKFNPRFEVSVFPQGQKYSLVSFGVDNIITHLQKFETTDEQLSELDHLKKTGKITIGRFTLSRQQELSSGDIVFLCSQTYLTLPCVSRAMFVYTRKMLFDELEVTS